jgi:hypothetical protein
MAAQWTDNNGINTAVLRVLVAGEYLPFLSVA